MQIILYILNTLIRRRQLNRVVCVHQTKQIIAYISMNAFLYMENKKEASASPSSYVINDLTRLGTGYSTFVSTALYAMCFLYAFKPFSLYFFCFDTITRVEQVKIKLS